MRMRVLLCVAAVCITVLGCTDTVGGSAVRTHVVVGGIDSGALDTGDFPTVVQPPFGHAGTAHDGALLGVAPAGQQRRPGLPGGPQFFRRGDDQGDTTAECRSAELGLARTDSGRCLES